MHFIALLLFPLTIYAGEKPSPITIPENSDCIENKLDDNNPCKYPKTTPPNTPRHPTYPKGEEDLEPPQKLGKGILTQTAEQSLSQKLKAMMFRNPPTFGRHSDSNSCGISSHSEHSHQISDVIEIPEEDHN